MKNFVLISFVILAFGKLSFDSPWPDNARGTEISDMDYGQKRPGKLPVLFSPEYIKTKHRIHSSPAFSPDLSEVYWSIFPRTSDIKHKKETILFSKKVDKKWTKPEVVSFSGKYTDGGPLFSSNGNRLYFYSRRPLNNRSKSETKGEIWFVEKQDEGWGEPKHLKIDFKGEKYFFSISKNNNLYFTSGHGPGGSGRGLVDIYCARFVNGSYTKPERLPDDINSIQFVESDPLISPDEKYLIFYSFENPENFGQYDLFISYNTGNNDWTKSQNLGEQINTGYSRFPRFSPDGRYLFFVKTDGIYWIDCSVIYDLVKTE